MAELICMQITRHLILLLFKETVNWNQEHLYLIWGDGAQITMLVTKKLRILYDDGSPQGSHAIDAVFTK
jgi:hypothetical protein